MLKHGLNLTVVACLVIMVFQVSVAYAGIFPNSNVVFGEEMPDIAFAIGRNADNQEVSADATICIFEGFNDADYMEFRKYVGSRYEVNTPDVNSGVATMILSLGDACVIFSYDRNLRIATMTYPVGTRVETEQKTKQSGGKYNLPTLGEMFGEDVIPSLSKVINRPVSSIETKNSLTCETYSNFTIEEYEAYSAYLAECGCTVENSSVVENVMRVDLKKGDTAFVFTYNYAANTATVEYAQGTNTEPVITPKPRTTDTPRPTKVPTQTSNPESKCYNVALEYMKKVLKNPDSLKVHGYTATRKGNAYTFIIDYSAQNGFGGYNREHYMITVDANTNTVTSAFSY